MRASSRLTAALLGAVLSAWCSTGVAAPGGPIIEGTSGSKYELGRLAGKGGFGKVYKAWELRGEGGKTVRGRAVALKLYDSLAGAVDEDGALTKVKIAHVPRMLDEGYDDRRGQFLVTPWVGGKTMWKWKKAQKPDTTRVVVAVRKAACIVSRMNRKGWLHLDLKPNNLMIDRTGEVNVIDLGLAMKKGQGGTALASGSGTRQFMAPEQRVGGGPVDDRADVFALAGTLYAMLTGNKPIAHKTRPGQIATRLDRIGDPQLRAIVARGLAVNADDRYASAKDFADALAAWP
jgi:serine/threonine protein kinase